jgi:RecA/RadA recombinase
MDKELIKALELLDENNPFASFLDKSTLSRVEKWYSTGSYVLDAIISGKLRNGGIPAGRLTMLYGESGCFKSSLVQKILANAQKDGLIPVVFDSENAIDPEGAERLGLDTSGVKLVPIFNIEQCRNSIHKFLTGVKEKGLEGKFIIAIDSLGNLESALETARIEKDSTSVDMGTRARAIKSLLRTCTQLSAITKTPIIITNHLYDNPGDLHPTLVKNMPGGKSCVYLPSVSVQLMRKPVKEDAVKSESGGLAVSQRNYVGIIVRALTAKNRFIKQYLEGELYVSFTNGADKYHGLLELAVELGIIQQGGATYSFNGDKLGYAKSFISDSDFWENKIIPLMEDKIKKAWAYSSEQDRENKELEKEAEQEGGEEDHE